MKFFKSWARSLSYLQGELLARGGWFQIIIISISSGIGEEFYARGTVFVLYNYTHEKQFNILLLLIMILLNLFWTANHLLNKRNDLASNFSSTYRKSLAHLIVIFILGLIFNSLMIKFNTLTTPIVAHFTFNLLFSILYRNLISANNNKAPD